jgi:hypothetical protein
MIPKPRTEMFMENTFHPLQCPVQWRSLVFFRLDPVFPLVWSKCRSLPFLGGQAVWRAGVITVQL